MRLPAFTAAYGLNAAARRYAGRAPGSDAAGWFPCDPFTLFGSCAAADFWPAPGCRFMTPASAGTGDMSGLGAFDPTQGTDDTGPRNAPADPTWPTEAHLLMALVDSSGQAYLAWSTNGGQGWTLGNAIDLGAGVTCNAPLALAQWQGEVFVAYTTQISGAWQIGVARSTDGKTWTTQVLLSSTTYSGNTPSSALCAAGDYLYVGYPDLNDSNAPVVNGWNAASCEFDTTTNYMASPVAGGGNRDKEVTDDEGGLSLASCQSGGTSYLYCLFPETAGTNQMSWYRATVGNSGALTFTLTHQHVSGSTPNGYAAGRGGIAVMGSSLYTAYCTCESSDPHPNDYGFAFFYLQGPATMSWTDKTPTLSIEGAPRAPSLATDGTNLFLAYKGTSNELVMCQTSSPTVTSSWTNIDISTPPIDSMSFDPAILWVPAQE